MEQSSSHPTTSSTNDDISNTSPTPITRPSPSRTFRMNWIRRSWNQISGTGKVILLVSFAISVIQISVTSVALAIGSNNNITCEKPLHLYLIIFVARVGLSLPLSIHQYLCTPRGRRRFQRRRNANATDATTPTTTTAVAENNESPTIDTTNQADSHDGSNNNNNQHQEVVSNQQEEEHHPPTHQASLVNGWAERVKSLLDLFAILWFIVGNYLIFSPSDCRATAALYYYTILCWVILGYLVLLSPILSCAVVLICFPHQLPGFRYHGRISSSRVKTFGTKEEIAKIPVFRYESISNDNSSNTNTSENSTITTVNTKKPSFIKRIMRKQHSKHSNSDQQTQQLDTMTIPRAEDAICSICLGEYETDELVCKLWCQHHYHKDCIHEWLGSNSKCPLCKRDFRGKDYVDNSDNEDTEEGY